MKIIRVQEPCGPGMLIPMEVDDPEPQDDEVVIQVMAIAVNTSDVIARKIFYPMFPQSCMGLECSGIIEKAGKNVKDWGIGNKVCAILSGGGYAEKVVVQQWQLFLVPIDVSFPDAACLPHASCVVWSELFMQRRLSPFFRLPDDGKKARLSAGKTLLVLNDSRKPSRIFLLGNVVFMENVLGTPQDPRAQNKRSVRVRHEPAAIAVVWPQKSTYSIFHLQFHYKSRSSPIPRESTRAMASLLANSISLFSSDSPRFPKPFFLHPNNFLNLPTHKPSFSSSSQILKARADVEPNPSPESAEKFTIQEFLRNRDYDTKFGFNMEIDSTSIPKGLSKETIRLISQIKQEPAWMLEFRLQAYDKFTAMKEPNWSDNRYPKVDFQDMCYYSAPTQKKSLGSLDEADPELLKYFERLGVPLNEQNRLANVAVDAVLDSVSIATTHRKTLEEAGVIFCSISEAIREYPDLVREYLGKVVPAGDNYYAALNAAVFSDGSFCYVPKDTKCPMQISTYFRINALETGQFERTLIVAEDRSFVEYLEGCTAPSYDRNQLHAAVVELYCAEGAEIKYSTVQNWYAGDEEGKGGIYNFVTKRGRCAGARSKISWTQVETGSAITWKYPSVVLEGDDSVGEFYSVALTNNYQQADTGTKMIHKGKNTRSRIISKGISAGNSRNCYRGLVQVFSQAENARNSSQCDSMLIGDKAAANTYPYIEVKNPTARIEHEASTSKIGEDQLFYFQQRGIDYEKAMAAMISGFCQAVFNELPDEFGSEVNQLIGLKLEGTVG